MHEFKLEVTDGSARAGKLYLAHGDVSTPAFMPVATQGSVKAVDPEDLASIGTQIILANTYHLYLRPGLDVIEKLGGLNNFMCWDLPILTDSGGFQVYSLEHLREMTEDSVVFKSHLDGALHTFSPEDTIKYQELIGSDIAMPLDVCLSVENDRGKVNSALERTVRWARRSLEAHSLNSQLLFGIVQGGMMLDLRDKAVSLMRALDFDGYAIGGLSVGEPKSQMYEVLKHTVPMLPSGLPRYLMGVGSPEDLVESVALGVDMFDCVLPTRIARNGSLFVSTGRVNITAAKFRNLEGPIERDCGCYTCCTFSAAYLHHLFRANELLAYRLATVHNVWFIVKLMQEIRSSILDSSFDTYRIDFAQRFVPTDEQTRLSQKKKWEKTKGFCRKL